jgi:hypothetical protein
MGQADISTIEGGPRATGRGSDRPRLIGLSDALLLLAACAVVAFRFLVLRSGGAPATIDAGNWLAFGNALFGGHARSPSIVYPPVVPLLVKGFVEAFGLVNGVAALGALASTAPAAGFYVALRRIGYRVEALPGALLLLGASAVGEATAWGGFPQLAALGITPLMLLELDRWLSTGKRGHALGTGLLLSSLLATSHFIGLAASVAAALILAMGVSRLRSQHIRSRLKVDLLLVLGPSAWLVPLYLNLAHAYLGTSEEFSFLNELSRSNVLERIEFLSRDFPYLWRFLLPLTVLTPFLLYRLRGTALWRILTSLLVAAAGLALITRQERFLYFATMVAALGIAIWLVHIRSRLKSHISGHIFTGTASSTAWASILVLAVAVSLWQVVAGARFFEGQRDYYGILTPGVFQGLELLSDETSPNAVLAVPSIQDAPLGWWVEAITERKTYYASALRWLTFDDERERARVANEIFTPTFPDPKTIAVAEEHNVSYLIIPTNWAHFREGPVENLVHDRGPAFYHTPDVVIVDMNSE